jgi:hypothetical protein
MSGNIRPSWPNKISTKAEKSEKRKEEAAGEIASASVLHVLKVYYLLLETKMFRSVFVQLKTRNGSKIIRTLATEAAVVRSQATNKAPLTTRIAWFSYGLNITLALGLYQLGQDSTESSRQLDQELQNIRQDTAATQKGLRAKIAKLEDELGQAKRLLEQKQ